MVIFTISNVNKLAGQMAIPVAGDKLWNEIPIEIRNAESLDTFSSKLKTFYLSQQQNILWHTRFLFLERQENTCGICIQV